MSGYEPFELGGAYSWFTEFYWGAGYGSLPDVLFARLIGGEVNVALHSRDYAERSEALADLGQALKDADGNFVGGAA